MKSIQLNAREKQLKGLLLDVAAFIDKTDERAGAEPLVLRWAGGWVRDKLLGIESNDIDTAINSMTGFPFAEKMREFCDKPDNKAKHRILPRDVGSLHKVAANPKKSKHLETATIKLFDIEVDFVNLRKETYAEDSRNPQMEFGTAEEDALRRDATVNALFYNLHTDEVEDFTSGLSDMERKLIRTPLDPLQTFMDDPLRVLRLVRFASRLQFNIDPAVEKVMGDSKVLEALRLKITRERVGVEVEKMLKGKHPRDSLALIDRLGLYHTVFTDPARSDMPRPDTTSWSDAYRCLDNLSQGRTPDGLYRALVPTDEDNYFAWALAAVVPWEQLDSSVGSTLPRKQLPLATQAAREGIKASNKLCDIITEAHRHRQNIEELKQAISGQEDWIHDRGRVGMAVREWDSKAGHWRLQVLYSLLVEFVLQEQPKAPEKTLESWQELINHLELMDLMDAPNIKRLIDGSQLSKALGVKPGKWMTGAINACMEWQLRNPGATDAAGAVEEVRKRRDELGIPAS